MENFVSNGFLALPTIFIVLNFVGALIALVWRRTGIAVALGSGLCLFAAATPVASCYLVERFEAVVPKDVDFGAAQAIVVIGGDVRLGNRDDIPDALGPISLERVVLGAAAYRRLHLPMLVSGGKVAGAQVSEAALMKAALDENFSIPVVWAEDRSRTTWENAVYTGQLLQPEKLTTVVLVTQAWHLPRALWAFERVGMKALPWPAPRPRCGSAWLTISLPSIAALHDTAHALHEMIGGVYYRLCH